MKIKEYRAKGSGLIVFAAVLIPSALYGVAVTADHGRSIIAARQTISVAESVVMAAINERSASDGLIDKDLAIIAGLDMYSKAIDVGMFSSGVSSKMLSNNIIVSEDRKSVSVTIFWKTSTLPLSEIFINKSSRSGQITRTSWICSPNISEKNCAK